MMNFKIIFIAFLFSIAAVAQNKGQSVGFRENKGQIVDQNGKPNKAVKYLLNSSGLNVQLKKNGFSYDVYETEKHPLTENQLEKTQPKTHFREEKEKLPDYTLSYKFHRIDIDFLHSNPNVALLTEEKSTDYDNYYNIPNKPEGVLMVHKYQQVTYQNIYPNIDVVFSIPKDSLKTVEYNFVVRPGGKISDIQLKFSGAKTELVANKIKMQVRFGDMEETLPMSWTEDGDFKEEIAVGYKKIKKDVYGFACAENVAHKTVVIDPVPTRLWGTFYGDGNYSTFKDIDTDKSGYIYYTGYTVGLLGTTIYASSGAHQTTIGNPTTFVTDGIIAKFDSAGKRMWGTFYGGENWDYIHGLKVDNENNLVITGNTYSKTNISTSNSIRGYADVFLVKFDTTGKRIWGRYFGGEVDENGFDVDIDALNNIYIVGTTRSYTGISINNSHQTLLNGIGSISNSSFDGFISKFDKNGTILWSTYVGGRSSDELKCIKVTADYLVTGGNTLSLSDISTPGTFQENNYKNTINGTVYKFTLDGNRIWSTYYGSSNRIKAIDIDNANNVYVGGKTTGSNNDDNIASPGSFDDFNQLSEAAFIAKLTPNGERVWGTYLGVRGEIYSIILKDNFIYLGGMSGDKTITTPCAYENEGFAEGYIGKFTTSGNLVMGTFVGGFDQYSENKICLDNFNNIIIGGTTSFAIKTDIDSYQPNMLGNNNFYLMKFSEDSTMSISVTPTSNSPVCLGNQLIFDVDSGFNYLWSGPNGFSSNLQNPFIDNTTIANSGTYNIIITNDCGLQKNYDLNVTIGDIQPPVPNLATLPPITGDCHTQITTIPTATDACAGTITATTTSPATYTLPGTYTIVWNYDDGNGNSITQNQTVIIIAQPLPVVTSPQTFCIQQNATLNDLVISGQNIKWYNALTGGNTLANTTLLQNNSSYYASQTINGCESQRVAVFVNIQNTQAPTGNSNQQFCSSQNATLSDVTTTGTEIKWYNNATLGNKLANTTLVENGKTYYATQTQSGCESPTRLPIAVSLITSLPANNYEEAFCDDLNDGTETIDITDYIIKMVSNTTNLSFTFYKTLAEAEEGKREKTLTNTLNYKINLGENKVYLRVNSNTPCYGIAELKLTLFAKPIIKISDIIPICENKTIVIDAGSGYSHYLWSNGATTQSIATNNPGNFSVTLTNDHNAISCSNTKNFVVKKSNQARITSIETQDWTDDNNIISVFVTGNGDYEYSIDGNNYQDSNQFTGLINGKKIVYVKDKNGCGTANKEVFLLMYPTFFTPNGDGYNDRWFIQFSDFNEFLGLKIYDRYGTLIKIFDSNSNDWDGKLNGNDLPADDYWFTVTRASGKELKGHFCLKR